MSLEKNEDSIKAVFQHAKNICLNQHDNSNSENEAKFLRYLADYLNSQARTMKELDDLLGELK